MSDEPSRNAERVVKCPVEGCDAEKLARGMYLHVLRSVGDGHGEQGEIPDEVSLDDLEEVGTREVEVNYPAEREVESVARLCPYCGVPFRGKHGVLIHLGQVAGRKNHPPNASKVHEPEDFPVVELDDNENIVGVVSSRPAESPDSDVDEQEADEPEAFAVFSKDEVDYLSAVIHSETNDERAKTLLQRPYLRE
ncbi:hypothetical protein [Haloparvum sedimenti]|uniref:hypothetical protein n=1 Tax=Haloparvum sedimenti TaxID=1678448 RepID=UPI0009B5B72B|nr:hypothetical protein [Haloparvum sedimenti]